MAKKNKNKIPKNIAESVPFDAIYEDGIIELYDGSYTKTYWIDSMSFRIESEEKQWGIGEEWSKFLGSLGGDVDIEITLHKETINMDKFQEDMFIKMQSDEFNHYRDELNDIMLNQISEGRSNYQLQRYITFKLKAENIKDAIERFTSIETALKQTAKTLEKEKEESKGLDYRILNAVERLDLLNKIYHAKDTEPLYRKTVIHGREVESFTLENCRKQGISPKSVIGTTMKFEKNHFVLGEETYGRCYYITNFPTWVKGDILTDFADVSGNVLISLHLHAFSAEESARMVKSTNRNIRASIVEKQKKSSMRGDIRITAPDESDALEQTEALNESIAKNDNRLFTSTLVFSIFADTEEELRFLEKRLFTQVRKNQFTIRPLTYQMENGFNSSLPLGVNSLSTSRLLTADSVAAFTPFSDKDVMQAGGFSYGINSDSRSLVIYNRANDVNSNGVILGTPGSGKSFAAKLEMLHVLLSTDAYVYILDPEGEYSALAQAMGGEVIKLSSTSKTHINPFDINLENVSDDDVDAREPVKAKAKYIEGFCEMCLGSRYTLTPTQNSVIDRCAIQLYQEHVEYLKKNNKTIDIDAAPTIHDFYEILQQQPEPEAKSIALALERYVDGAEDMFSYRTNVNVENRFIVYDIHELTSGGMQELGLSVALNNVFDKMIENKHKGKKTWMYIDEYYLLMKQQSIADYVAQIWKRARKWGGIPTAITQNIEDVINSPQARTILTTSNFVIMMKQTPFNVKQLTSVFALTPKQQEKLTQDRGLGLLRIGEDSIPIDNRIPDDIDLFELINTKPTQF